MGGWGIHFKLLEGRGGVRREICVTMDPWCALGERNRSCGKLNLRAVKHAVRRDVAE